MTKSQDGGTSNNNNNNNNTTTKLNIIKKLMPDSLNEISYSSKQQTNTYIVIHNTGGREYSNVSNAIKTVEYFHLGAGGANTSTHYCMDDKEIYQILENEWKGHHVGGTRDEEHKSAPMSNSNTIGIEIADGPEIDHKKAINNAIELTRHLMEQMNIDVNHVVRHYDVTGKDCPYTIMNIKIDGKNGWDYFLEQIKKRNEKNEPIAVDPISSTETSAGGNYTTGGISNVTDILPNVDHRYNIANMDEVKGACLVFYPPYNACSMTDRENQFKEWGWDRKYHYIIDHTYDVDTAPAEDDIPEITECTATLGTTTPDSGTPEDGKENENKPGTGEENLPVTPASFYVKSPTDTSKPEDDTSKPEDTSKPTDTPSSNSNLGWTTPEVNSPDAVEDNCITIKGGFEKVENRLLQCYGLEDNNKVTYINRSLFNNHPEKHNIMIACFIPSYEDLEKDKITYEQVEKNIVNSVSKILWANGLNTKDLWREFDMNRAPSPVTYLDRDKWKDLLTEIDKVLEWRNKKFGVVSATYEKYVAVIPEYIHSSNSGGNDGSLSGPGNGTVDEGMMTESQEGFFKALAPGAQQTQKDFGVFASVTLVQAALESNWGKSTVAKTNKNLFGIKYTGKYAPGITVEEKGCKCPASEQGGARYYNYYQSYADSVYDHGWFLKNNSRYTKHGVFNASNGIEQVKAIAAAGYAEDPNYASKLTNMINKYNLMQYDKVASGASISMADIVFSIKAKGSLSWPCPSTKSISSRFGYRKPPCPGASSNHKGIDIPCPSGSDVVAAADGKVVVVSSQSARGNYVVIDHGGNLGTLYQHLSRATVSVGDSVKNGQTIAKSGATGVGVGAHLHFEVHEGFSGTRGTPVDPENYVSPGTAKGSISGDSGGGTPGSGNSGGTGDGSYDMQGPLVNSPHGDIVNPGPAASLPYNGNSMGGLDHDDWGGKTIYKVGEPEDESLEKPVIENVLTSEEYKEFCDKFFVGEVFNEDGTFSTAVNFKKYWELIDIYVADFEPYDKGLVEGNSSDITPNDRLNALTINFTSDNENTFHFNVVESGPGSADHCVKSADELNVVVVPKDLKIEPIYPDLVIPPHYSTTDYDEASPNTVPLSMLTASSDEETEKTDMPMKQLAFDYNLLSGKKKETNPCSGPINFLDPYPTDDKIQELENHYPKVFIDEIESQMYSCNHPGCPIAQPMAKNFAMLQDAIMNQSKRVEQRLCKLENILSTVMRNQSRLGARININCVYYGGQSIYGKYKCIRCLHDDRIHDGAIVTLDQCLNCTRYEPILGQVYQILDETGLNASIILDDMQMSYSDLYAMQQLNMGTLRSPQYDYVEVSGDKNCKKPEKTRIDIWKEANKEIYLKKKEEGIKLEEKTTETIIEGDAQSSQNIDLTEEELRKLLNTDDESLTIEDLKNMLAQTPTNDMSVGSKTVSVDDNGNVKIKQIQELFEAKETDYIFRMDWNLTYFNQQEADVKTYPAEGIIARYKKEDPDVDYETYLLELDPELDKDTIEDVFKEMSLIGGQWVDTREKAETIQTNKYSSEKFYFDGFAEMKTSVGAAGSGSGGGLGSGSAECRSKIVEMAAKIVADYDAGKAKYCQSPRTVQYDQPKSSGGKVCYDCTSMVSCCYHHAGLKSMYDKSCSGGSLIAEIVNNGGKMWLLNDAGLQEAKPGDVVLKANSKVSQSDMNSKIATSHAMIYVGDGKISHASSSKSGIKTEDLKSSFRWKDGKHFFVRPRDLIDADAQAAATSPGSVDITKGSIDGKSYVAKISGAVCTSYYGGGGKGASGLGLENGKTCASHNMPYGTKIYIPSLKNKLGGDGIVTVTDTGGPLFDFDLYTNKSVGKTNADVYVLSWGTGKVAPSYTWGLNFYSDSQWNNLKSAWNKYKSMNGQLMNFLKFNQEDTNIKNHKRY